MKLQHMIPMLMLAACGTGSGEPSATLSLANVNEPLMLAPVKGGSEHDDADEIPDHALDRAFTYALRLKDKLDEEAHLISTLIPHAKGFTYSLVNETVLKDSIWQITFKAEEDELIERGVYLHVDHEVPVVFSGHNITEVEVLVLDVNGNATGEIGGVPGQPKTKKPKRVRWMDAQELDPAMPPLEDVAIYLNGGEVEGERYLVGYAHMNEKSKGLSTTNNTVRNRVEFAALDDSEGHAFLFFDHNVTDLGEAMIATAFTDGDGVPLNTPRETRDRP